MRARARTPISHAAGPSVPWGEGRNLVGDGDYAHVLADLRERLHEWMIDTEDPLLRGPVVPPVGARINSRSQRSAEEPTHLITEAEAPIPR
jgi:hypothetical protein